MERYFKRKKDDPIVIKEDAQTSIDLILRNLPSDPGLRPKMSDYAFNDRDAIRRWYIQNGPCQPVEHIFPQTVFGKKKRRFNSKWFRLHSDWLDYSISLDSVFCLCCYLFKEDIGNQSGGEIFVTKGFKNWKKPERLFEHVGGVNSSHSKNWKKYCNFENTKNQTETVVIKQDETQDDEYRTILTATLHVVRYLISQGLSFRGHNESDHSLNKGNFLHLLELLAKREEKLNKAIRNAPGNQKMRAPSIQKQMTASLSFETTEAILKDLNHDIFSILIDGSRDLSGKEQMSVVLRYVNNKGCVMERLLGLSYVTDTSALSLKKNVDNMFSKHNLSIFNIRGQGYDGASNMSGDMNGLKSLILKENNSAHYIHCFAHQLQLTLVAVSSKDLNVATFFNTIANATSIVTGSSKRLDILREKHLCNTRKAIALGEAFTGTGQNQERSLKRAGDTRWGSHFGSITNLIHMFGSVLEVLLLISNNGIASTVQQRVDANNVLISIKCFDFIFYLHMMESIMSITNDLSQALQRKDQDLVNAMKLVKIVKQRLQLLRDDGWENLLTTVSSFCEKHNIEIVSMDDKYAMPSRHRRNIKESTNLYQYQVEHFYHVLDMQLQELNRRFDEKNTELLFCMSCFDPSSSFRAFDAGNIKYLFIYLLLF